MTTTLSETSTFTATVTLPSPGETVKTSDLEAAIGPVANRTQWLNDHRIIAVYEEGTAGNALLGFGLNLLHTWDSTSPVSAEDTVVMNALAGDMLFIYTQLTLGKSNDVAIGIVNFGITEEYTSGSSEPTNCARDYVYASGLSDIILNVGLHSTYDVQADGHVRVTLQGRVDNAAYELYAYNQLMLRVIHYRP